MENADQLTLEAGEIYKPLNVRNVTVENSIADLAQFAIG
jgi:hypothetical protein